MPIAALQFLFAGSQHAVEHQPLHGSGASKLQASSLVISLGNAGYCLHCMVGQHRTAWMAASKVLAEQANMLELKARLWHGEAPMYRSR